MALNRTAVCEDTKVVTIQGMKHLSSAQTLHSCCTKHKAKLGLWLALLGVCVGTLKTISSQNDILGQGCKHCGGGFVWKWHLKNFNNFFFNKEVMCLWFYPNMCPFTFNIPGQN